MLDVTVWITAGLGCMGGGLMFLLSSFQRTVRALDYDLVALSAKVGSIEVIMAGNYLRKEDFSAATTVIFTKLDRIEDKLDKKADK